MKLPYSYRRHFFNSFLAISFVSHAVFFGFGHGFFSTPKYAVEDAPNSVEWVMIEPPKMNVEPTIREEKALTTEAMTQLEVLEEKKREMQERVERESIQLRADQGALTEANPAYLKNPAPIYPRLARMRGWEGVVLLKVYVRKDGRAEQVQVNASSGYRILDDAAVKAVSQWHFLPARLGRHSFGSWIKIPIRFVLEEEKNE